MSHVVDAVVVAVEMAADSTTVISKALEAPSGDLKFQTQAWPTNHFYQYFLDPVDSIQKTAVHLGQAKPPADLSFKREGKNEHEMNWLPYLEIRQFSSKMIRPWGFRWDSC